MKPTVKPSLNEVALQWDDYADERYEAILKGQDTSYVQQLMPFWLDAAPKYSKSRTLDLGCGVGFLTKELSKFADEVQGIDPSGSSIKIAKSQNSASNVYYQSLSAAEFVKGTDSTFDFIACNMVLMDAPDLAEVLDPAFSVQAPGGYFLATVANPSYWPRYWGYEKEIWFDYQKETFIDVNFKTAGTGQTGRKITHIHRPLSAYIGQIIRSGYVLENLFEFGPSAKILHGQIPKFLGFGARKLG